MHCVCSGLYTDVSYLEITDMCLAQTCCHNTTLKSYCKSSCICWQCYCRHVSCCWTLSSSRKSFTCNGDSVISHFVDKLFSRRWLSVDRSLLEITLQANKVQSDVLVQLSEVCCVRHCGYPSLFWILSRIGQSDVVRYGANYCRGFCSTIFIESCTIL